MWADTFHHTGAEVFLDTFQRSGRYGLYMLDFKLHAMTVIVKPYTGGFYKFAGRDRGRTACHGDQFTLTLAFNPDNEKAGFFTVKGYSLNRTFKPYNRLMVMEGILMLRGRENGHR